MKESPFVRLSGTPVERGFQHGQALSEAIHRLYNRWMAEAAKKTPAIEERDAVAYAMGHLPEGRAYAPDLVEEVEGIAAGAGLPFEKAWFLNCFDEANGLHLYRALNAGHSCTTFAASGLSTVDGTTYVAQTYDMPDWYDSVILQIEPGGAERGALVYTHPGIVGGSGMNSDGVSLVWNSMRPTDARYGVPCPFLIRKALQQPKLSDAVGAVLGGVRAIGFNFVIGADFGAVNVEATATRYHVRYIGRHFGHANHYEELELRGFEGDLPLASSTLIRGGRINQLLDEAAGRIDLEMCQGLLRDHADYPGSICAHMQPPRRGQTVAALLYVPAQRRLLATNGPACENPFVEYRLATATGAIA